MLVRCISNHLAFIPGKTKAIKDLQKGATVAIPNDPSNEARALLLLEAADLIKLKDGAGINATIQDIAENPLNLNIKEVEAAKLPVHYKIRILL